MHIAVDAMGGDNAPHVNIEGAIEALELVDDLNVILVGDQQVLKSLIKKYKISSDRLSIQHASQVIAMHESPAQALRKKKDSSINVMYRLQKEKIAVAAVGAGHTGAMMAGGLMALGRLKGVIRPAIATFMPAEKGLSIILDVGANVDCKPTHLIQFAYMGNIYCKHMLDKESPRIGLLNIGEESTKGNELAVETHELLSTNLSNFIGNVEGRDIFKGHADVIVCDGFIGNIVLKFAEAMIGYVKSTLKKATANSILAKGGLLLIKPSFSAITKKMDYSEYGGAPLLGINGVGIVCHGKSNAKAIKNAIIVAKRFVDKKVNDLIREQIA